VQPHVQPKFYLLRQRDQGLLHQFERNDRLRCGRDQAVQEGVLHAVLARHQVRSSDRSVVPRHQVPGDDPVLPQEPRAVLHEFQRDKGVP
jgi:hypothetical protein